MCLLPICVALVRSGKAELNLLEQGAMSQLKQVADDKVATKDVINQKDAAKIASAEAKLNDGQIPANSVSSKAQAS